MALSAADYATLRRLFRLAQSCDLHIATVARPINVEYLRPGDIHFLSIIALLHGCP